MDLNIWLAYVVTEFLLSVTPGPAVLLISSQGLKYGSKTSYFGSFGISTANFIYFVLSALGLGTLIVEASNLFEIIKIAGALYLIYIGIKMIIQSFNTVKNQIAESVESPKSYKSAFFNAFVTQASNPKAIIFFVALLPQFVDPKANVFYQFSILALTTIFMETLILMLYGWLSSKGGNSLKSDNRVTKWIDRAGGGILVGIGINLFFLKDRS